MNNALASDHGVWPAARARQWYDAQPWPCGFNYVPAHAVSYTEMWMGYNFDPGRIDAELALAQGVGFNGVRVVLPFVVWEHEAEAFRQRFDTFLGLCARRGLRVIPALFDDCVFGPITDPVFGPQPALVPGWYASAWTPSPGHAMVRDPATWPRLEKYVTQVIATWKDDPRLYLWDLYNEPTNSGTGEAALALVDQVFQRVGFVNPTQPLTVGQWNANAALNQRVAAQSDIITFHDYSGPEALAQHIASLKTRERPIICTEWLNRGQGSTVRACLPIFWRQRVGCMSWGLVNGKTQTHLNWGHRPGDPEPQLWQHDLFHRDHMPYDPAELELFSATIRGAAPNPDVPV